MEDHGDTDKGRGAEATGEANTVERVDQGVPNEGQDEVTTGKATTVEWKDQEDTDKGQREEATGKASAVERTVLENVKELETYKLEDNELIINVTDNKNIEDKAVENLGQDTEIITNKIENMSIREDRLSLIIREDKPDQTVQGAAGREASDIKELNKHLVTEGGVKTKDTKETRQRMTRNEGKIKEGTDQRRCMKCTKWALEKGLECDRCTS